MGGILTGNDTTSWLHLASNGAECGNTHVRYLRLKLQYSNGLGQTNTKYSLMGGDRLTQNIFWWMGTDNTKHDFRHSWNSQVGPSVASASLVFFINNFKLGDMWVGGFCWLYVHNKATLWPNLQVETCKMEINPSWFPGWADLRNLNSLQTQDIQKHFPDTLSISSRHGLALSRC